MEGTTEELYGGGIVAQRRMLARNVATSARVATIPWFTEALWLRGIPFCDDAGMIDANPEEIKTLLLPRGKSGKQIPVGRIEVALEELEKVGLITIHSCELMTCLRYVNFEKFQTLPKDRPLQVDCKQVQIACLSVISIGLFWDEKKNKYFLARAPGTELNRTELNETEVKEPDVQTHGGKDGENHGKRKVPENVYRELAEKARKKNEGEQ
jgi:hypothetical protein